TVQIRFHQDFNGGGTAFGEIADVDVSTDGGASWTNALRQTPGIARPTTQSIDVTGIAAGQPDVRARFHYYNAFAAWWWQVDDVVLGHSTCVPLSGGLVVGKTHDARRAGGRRGVGSRHRSDYGRGFERSPPSAPAEAPEPVQAVVHDAGR